ncbi:MAG: ABC transporter substrate-binding protein [Burkholderiales bacterium]|nr:ABC transporter substrate-binding protein [Burkholderiales bacterium]
MKGRPTDAGDARLDRARRRLGALLLGSPWAGVGWAATAATLAAQAAQAAQSKGPLAAGAAAAADPAPASGGAHTGRWVHGFAAYGAPKYGPDFSHFEYVDPEAPKGGTLKLKNPDRRSSFDKFNPWTLRGNSPAGVLIWMIEGLAHLGQDEPMSMYGLLAEAMLLAPDYSSITFRIRPEARFHNGEAVTAEDVRHSFAMLSGKAARPDVQTQLAGLERVEVLDARTVRFHAREKTREQMFIAGTMPVFSRKWGEGKPFDQIVTEYPIASGPYRIDRVDMPRRIEFRLDPDYWGRHLPVRRGHFNFERVVYRNYADDAVAREAFKAGEFDLMKEYRSRAFVRQHAGVKWDDGRIKKAVLPTRYGQYLQSYQLNLRRPIFQDIRVREALGYTYDFETLNKTKMFTRASSAFNNSDFAAQGPPSPAELALLEPFRAELPPRVFGPAFVAPRTDADPNGLRRNLLKARELLEQAGWKLDAAGVLRNGKGEPFVFEYMQPLASSVVDWQRNLKKLGIEMRVRLVDFALYRRRLQQYDFDTAALVEGRFTLPQGAELAASYGSKSADDPGNNNFRGVKSRAVDALIEAMNRADSLPALRDAARALDRVIMWNFWQIPDLWQAQEPISYWNKFGSPKVTAHYYQADTLISGFIEHGPWPLWTWWDLAFDKTRQARAGKV